MNYTEGIIRNTEFFTTAELADKLKMNVQVITRKVQAGEIRAYKIGKEWRIPEPSVYEWLEANVNTSGTAPAKRLPVTAHDTSTHNGGSPAEKRRHLLEYVLAQLEPIRLYTEKEIDRHLSRHFDDCPSVRREFVERRMIEMENGLFRRRAGYRIAD